MTATGTAMLTITEMREFASFAPAEQRYIRRALDIGLARQDAFRAWARSPGEEAAIRTQYIVYQDLKVLRREMRADIAPRAAEAVLARLIRVAGFDLAQERLASFAAFRFLYERLLGAAVRPLLPAAFCAAGTLPHIRPERRRTLLQSLSEAAATAPGWSEREPVFFPEYIAREAEAA